MAMTSLRETSIIDSDRHPDVEKTAIRVKELAERDRRRLLMHFLELDDNDRLLRFGAVLSDERITRYVQLLDFRRDALFGVYDEHLVLVGVGHLAFALKEAHPFTRGGTGLNERVGELGVSVSVTARAKGIGSKLFQRAIIHCRNEDVNTLYMHCLTSNQTMMHVAKKVGMTIQREQGEANCYLKLLPGNSRSVLCEAVEEQVALFDYTFKVNTHTASKWWRGLRKIK